MSILAWMLENRSVCSLWLGLAPCLHSHDLSSQCTPIEKYQALKIFWFVFFGTRIFFTCTWISNYFSPRILMCNCAVADTTRLCPRTGGGKRSTATTSCTICSPVCLCRCIWLAADDSGHYGSNCAWSCAPSVFVLFGENHQLICTLSTGLECRWPASSLFWFISKPGWWAFQGTFSSPVFHTPMVLLAIYFVIQSFS